MFLGAILSNRPARLILVTPYLCLPASAARDVMRPPLSAPSMQLALGHASSREPGPWAALEPH